MVGGIGMVPIFGGAGAIMIPTVLGGGVGFIALQIVSILTS